MRILWMSPFPPITRSGYSQATREMVPRLQGLGHKLAVFAFHGLRGCTIETEGIPVYGNFQAPYGQDILSGHYRDFAADLLITCTDTWAMEADVMKEFPWLAWMPVDHSPPPEAVLAPLKECEWPVSFSKWGEGQLLEAGVDEARYIPLGVDSAAYSPGDRDSERKARGWPQDAFIIVSVAANRGVASHKAWPEWMQAVSLFGSSRPDLKILYYCHTMMSDLHGGADLVKLAELCKMPANVALRFPNVYQYAKGISQKEMIRTYRTADVLLAASYAEGFGLPILEAQACGIPVITTYFSSMPELTWAGYPVGQACKQFSHMKSWRVVPSVPEIITVLDRIEQGKIPEGALEDARSRAVEYDWDTLTERYWQPMLREVADEIGVE